MVCLICLYLKRNLIQYDCINRSSIIYIAYNLTTQAPLHNSLDLLLCWWAVHAHNNGMITFVGLQRELFLWFKFICLHLLHLSGKDSLWLRCGINAGCLDGDDEMAAILKEMLCIQCHNTTLIRLCHIGKDGIDHADQHAILVWMTGVLNNGNNVGTLLGHINQITARTVRELNGIDKTLRSNNIGYVRHSCARGATQVQHLGARWHVYLLHTAENGCGQLGTEGIPDTVLNLLAVGL